MAGNVVCAAITMRMRNHVLMKMVANMDKEWLLTLIQLDKPYQLALSLRPITRATSCTIYAIWMDRKRATNVSHSINWNWRTDRTDTNCQMKKVMCSSMRLLIYHQTSTASTVFSDGLMSLEIHGDTVMMALMRLVVVHKKRFVDAQIFGLLLRPKWKSTRTWSCPLATVNCSMAELMSSRWPAAAVRESDYKFMIDSKSEIIHNIFTSS